MREVEFWAQKRDRRKKQWFHVKQWFLEQDLTALSPCTLLFFNFYSVVLVSAVPQRESPIIIHLSPSSWVSLLSPHPTPLGHHESTRLGSPCYRATSHQLSTTHDSAYMLILLSPFVPLSPFCTVSISPFSISTSPFMPCKQVHVWNLEKWYGWTPCTLDWKLLWTHGPFWRCNLCHDWFLPHLPCHSLSN